MNYLTKTVITITTHHIDGYAEELVKKNLFFLPFSLSNNGIIFSMKILSFVD